LPEITKPQKEGQVGGEEGERGNEMSEPIHRIGFQRRDRKLIYSLMACGVLFCLLLGIAFAGMLGLFDKPPVASIGALSEDEKTRRGCHIIFLTTSTKSSSELTVKDSELIGFCRTLGLYR
jgi:hypothetical protein